MQCPKILSDGFNLIIAKTPSWTELSVDHQAGEGYQVLGRTGSCRYSAYTCTWSSGRTPAAPPTTTWKARYGGRCDHTVGIRARGSETALILLSPGCLGQALSPCLESNSFQEADRNNSVYHSSWWIIGSISFKIKKKGRMSSLTTYTPYSADVQSSKQSPFFCSEREYQSWKCKLASVHWPRRGTGSF